MPSCSGSPTCEAPRLLLPQQRTVFWAAGPCTPRKERVVTHHALWYRYVPESGNWHDGTFTRKIEAFSAATCTPLLDCAHQATRARGQAGVAAATSISSPTPHERRVRRFFARATSRHRLRRSARNLLPPGRTKAGNSP